MGTRVSTSINCTMSYTIAPPQQKHAEVAEELQKTQAELQQLKASLADIEQETTAAERKKAVIFASFCEKSIATMLASVTSDMLYYILSSIVFGSEAKGTEREAGVKMDLKSEPTSVTPQHSEPSSEPLSIAEQAQLELEQNSWNDVESKDKTSPVVGLSAVMNQL